jgi:hypothetical protein
VPDAAQLAPPEAEHVQLTFVNADGRTSATVAPLTACGPLLVTAIVYVLVSFGRTVSFASDFVMERSAPLVGVAAHN